jgi:hypothetical protein
VVAGESRLQCVSLALAQKEFAEACPAKAQQHAQTEGCALKGRPLSTKPEIVCEGKLWHLDALVIDAQAACAIEANVCGLVGIAHAGTHRRSDIEGCRLFSTALQAPLVHKLGSTVGAGRSAVG